MFRKSTAIRSNVSPWFALDLPRMRYDKLERELPVINTHRRAESNNRSRLNSICKSLPGLMWLQSDSYLVIASHWTLGNYTQQTVGQVTVAPVCHFQLLLLHWAPLLLQVVFVLADFSPDLYPVGNPSM